MLQILEIILVFFESFNSTDTTETVNGCVSFPAPKEEK